MVCQPHEHGNGQQCWSVYSNWRGNGHGYCYINTGFDKIRQFYGDGDRSRGHCFRFCFMQPDVDPDESNLCLYGDGEWHGEFQQCRDLVPQPFKHRLREQHRCLYANNNRNRNDYGHLHAGRNQVGLDGSHRHEHTESRLGCVDLDERKRHGEYAY